MAIYNLKFVDNRSTISRCQGELVDAVTIEVATESRRCAIVSVQNNTVSNLDLAVFHTEYHAAFNFYIKVITHKIHYEKS